MGDQVLRISPMYPRDASGLSTIAGDISMNSIVWAIAPAVFGLYGL